MFIFHLTIIYYLSLCISVHDLSSNYVSIIYLSIIHFSPDHLCHLLFVYDLSFIVYLFIIYVSSNIYLFLCLSFSPYIFRIEEIRLTNRTQS